MSEDKLREIEQILGNLPHRYPFVLIDRVVDYDPGQKITGIKNITFNEWYFEGIPAGFRMVPALILCEAVAQLGSYLLFQDRENEGRIIFFLGIEKVRFRKPVLPGDTLVLTAEILKRKGRIGRFKVRGAVNERTAFDGVMRFAIESKGSGNEAD